MKFYRYNQSSVEGSFVIDPHNGLGHEVYIEAEDANAADYMALTIGIYFSIPMARGYPLADWRWEHAVDAEGWVFDSLQEIYNEYKGCVPEGLYVYAHLADTRTIPIVINGEMQGEQ